MDNGNRRIPHRICSAQSRNYNCCRVLTIWFKYVLPHTIHSHLFLGFWERRHKQCVCVCNPRVKVLYCGIDRMDNFHVHWAYAHLCRYSGIMEAPSGSITRYRNTILLVCDVRSVKNWLFVEKSSLCTFGFATRVYAQQYRIEAVTFSDTTSILSSRL